MVRINGEFPSFSADGQRIAFNEKGFQNITVMEPDGSHRKVVYEVTHLLLLTLTCYHTYIPGPPNPQVEYSVLSLPSGRDLLVPQGKAWGTTQGVHDGRCIVMASHGPGFAGVSEDVSIVAAVETAGGRGGWESKVLTGQHGKNNGFPSTAPDGNQVCSRADMQQPLILGCEPLRENPQNFGICSGFGASVMQFEELKGTCCRWCFAQGAQGTKTCTSWMWRARRRGCAA